MTFRALLLGLLLAVAVACFGYVNDWILKLAYMASDLIPVSVFGLLVLGLLLANPLMKLLRLTGLRAAEWAVVVSLMLMGCMVPGPALMWTFGGSMIEGHAKVRNSPAYSQNHFMAYLPPVMLTQPLRDEHQQAYEALLAEARKSPEPHRSELLRQAQVQRSTWIEADYDEAVVGYLQGLGSGKLDEAIPPSRVPWWAWSRTLSFWLPLLGVAWIGGLALMLAVHRQWAHNERLRYPVVEFASELLSGAGQRRLPSIFYNRRFWIGFMPAFAIIMINGYYNWSKGGGVEIPLTISMAPLVQKFPILGSVVGAGSIFNPMLFFATIGFSYFVASEVSLSLGISNILWTVLFVGLLRADVSFSGDYFEGGNYNWALFGAFLGAAALMLYTGRRFYLSLVARALMIRRGEALSGAEVWAFRIAILCATALVLMMSLALHLHPLLAVLLAVLTAMLFLVVARIHVETGMFFIQPYWQPVGVLMGLFGVSVLGPNMLAILTMLCVVLTMDPRIALLPLVANALRLGETQGVRLKPLASWMGVAVLVALVCGVFVTIYFQYNFSGSAYLWGGNEPLAMLERNLPKMDGDVTRDAAVVASAVRDDGPDAWHLARDFNLAGWNPLRSTNWAFVRAAGIGLVLFVVLSVLRLRCHWWPLHPVLVLVIGTFPLHYVGFSFLVGWCIKACVTSLGGGQAYRQNKPIFVGLIAGDFLAGITWAIIGGMHCLQTGIPGWPGFPWRVHP